MEKIDSIIFFIFVFSSLIVLRASTKFIGALLQKEPSVIHFSGRELIYLGLSISYILTFLIKR